MKSRGRQATEFLGDLPGRDSPRFGERFPDQEFRKNRTGSDGGDATLCLETGGSDTAILDVNRQPQNVAAYGIRYIHAGRRIGQITGVTRIAKMFENGLAEHRRAV